NVSALFDPRFHAGAVSCRRGFMPARFHARAVYARAVYARAVYARAVYAGAVECRRGSCWRRSTRSSPYARLVPFLLLLRLIEIQLPRTLRLTLPRMLMLRRRKVG